MQQTLADAVPAPSISGDRWIDRFAHDLRQPFSNIQSSVCYLRLVLAADPRVTLQLDLIEQQVQEAEALLHEAVRTARTD